LEEQIAKYSTQSLLFLQKLTKPFLQHAKAITDFSHYKSCYYSDTPDFIQYLQFSKQTL